MTHISHVCADQLKQLIERLERLESEKANITEGIREVFAEAKFHGYDVKILRQILKIRKTNSDDRAEQELLLDTYLHALGMAPSPEETAVSLPNAELDKTRETA